VRLRAATAEDAEAIAITIAEGFESYRAFAPEGWEPPAELRDVEALRRRITGPEVWCVVAEADGQVIGHCSFLPASLWRGGDADRGLAHLWQLFVRPAYWGSGVARALLDAAVEAAAERGYDRMRLFAAAGQARARRFYEREGWTAPEPPRPDPAFGMETVEYRRTVPR
jgi:GNAT superfamily N-acetyltransferase